MKTKAAWFNIYLAVAVALVVCAGCETHKKKKNLTILELHEEVSPDGYSDNVSVPIYRENPVYVNVDKSAFLDNADLIDADVVEALGGFEIRLKFNWRGTQILQAMTVGNRGKRIAVFCSFGQSRWLASPQIQKTIPDGVFSFTPDCTREEADQIVKGLKEATAKLKEDTSF